MKWNVSFLAAIILTPILLIGFQNCGFNSPEINITDQASTSTQSLSFKEGCETKIMAKYQNLFATTYHPFLSDTCKRCHTSGPGSGLFAFPDPSIAGPHFISRFEKINQNAVNSRHANEIADLIKQRGQIQQEAFIQNLRSQWTTINTEYVKCADVPAPGEGVITIEKSNPAILASMNNPATWTPIEWNLMTDLKDTTLRNKISATIQIEIRVARYNGTIWGYEFRNPSAKINMPSAPPLNLKTLRLYINKQYQSNVTTYALLDKIVSSDTYLNLAPGSALGLAVIPTTLVNTDTFSLEIASISDATGVSIEPTPVVVPPPSTLPATVTYDQLISNDLNLGVFKNACSRCHNATSLGGGFDITNPLVAKAMAQKIFLRTRDADNPMPQSGLMTPFSQDIIRIWVDGGAK